MSTFILIHGAAHGAWCWYKIVPRLREAGHEVIAMDLPGHGPDRSPTENANLASYTASVAQVLAGLSEPAILVGHSLGGLTLSQVAEQRPQSVKHLVYLTALMLANGGSVSTMIERFPEAMDPPTFIPDNETGFLIANPDHWREIFYGDCCAEDLALARSSLVPQHPSLFVEPMRLTEENFGSVPRTYIECLQDQAIPLHVQRALLADTPCNTLTMDCSHSPFFSQPDELSAHLLSLA